MAASASISGCARNPGFRALRFPFTGAILLPVLALLGFAEAGEGNRRRAGAVWPRSGCPLPPASADGRTCPLCAFGGLIAATVAARFIRSGMLCRGGCGSSIPTIRSPPCPRLQRAGSQPHRRHSAYLRLRRARALLHLPGPGDRRPPSPAAADSQERARSPHQGGAACAARLPVPADPRRVVVPLLSSHGPQRPDARSSAPAGPGTGAGDRGPVLRPARLHNPRRTPPALRHGLHPQPLFRGGGRIREDAGGYIDKFVGDGVLALFGLKASSEEAARQAVDAARRIHGGLADLNADY